MAIDSERTEPRSRRAILAGAIGGLAAVVAGRFASPDKASATHLPGFGHANAAGASDTSLTATTAGTALLVTQSGTGTALRGSATGPGSIAGFFTAQNGTGVSGVTGNKNSYGVFASNNGAADGSGGALRASGVNNDAIVATTNHTNATTVLAIHNADGTAVVGQSNASANSFGQGVQGSSDGDNGAGVVGFATSLVGGGVGAFSSGVWGFNYGALGTGVLGHTGSATGYGVYSEGNAHVEGNLTVSGSIAKGSGTFKIDHPLDPANKFLYHSFVESPDMKNVYDGVATLDAKGEAVVRLPAWFQALNKDFRYQLTAIGATDRVLYVKAKLKDNAFAIGGGSAGQEVSWQLTGIRQDAFANANRVVAEVAKTGAEKGRYLHPKEHGQPESKSIGALRAHPVPTIDQVKRSPSA
jgi:hypothetical protein